MKLGFDYYANIAFHIVGVVSLFFMEGIAITRKPSRLQVSNMLLVLFALLYTVGNYLQINTANLEVFSATVKIEYIGISGVLLSYTWFMNEYNGRKSRRRIFFIEGAFTVVSLVCIFGMGPKGLFFKTIRIVQQKQYSFIEKEPGILYICIFLYYVSIFLTSVYVCIRKMKESGANEKKRCILFLIGVLFPFLCAVIQVISPNRNFDFFTLGILGFVIFFTVGVNRADFLDSVQTEQELDFLTGLNLREKFVEQVHKNLNSGKKGSIVMLDMDDFKYINDHFGHQTGDKVLATLGDVLKDISKKEHSTCRFGGDEFCIFLLDIVNHQEVEDILNNLMTNFHKKLKKQGITYEPSISKGIAVYTGEQKETFEKLYEHADKALYLVKNSSKGKYKFYE